MGGIVQGAASLVGLDKLVSPPTIKVPKPPGAPTIDDAARREDMERRLRSRRGRAATVLAGATGKQPGVATKTLLGS